MKHFAVYLLFSAMALAQKAPQAALEGLDPIALIEGRETPGNPALTANHGRFLYQFANAANRERFLKDPERFGIQLGGACARMGPPVGANPDAPWVYNGRIYIFGSQDCYKAFTADPKKYLESEQPREEWRTTTESRARGRELMAKVVAAVGGAAALASVRSFTETRVTGSGDRQMRILRTHSLSGGYRSDNIASRFQFGEVYVNGAAYALFRDEGAPVPPEFAKAIRAGSRRDLLLLLASVHSLEVQSSAPGKLRVNDEGNVVTFEVDDAGRVAALSYRGRGNGGTFGENRILFSDYRKAGLLLLPFAAEGTFDGKPDSRFAWQVESYQLNPADLETRLAKPAKLVER